jgi:hypothetical protein
VITITITIKPNDKRSAHRFQKKETIPGKRPTGANCTTVIRGGGAARVSSVPVVSEAVAGDSIFFAVVQ